MKLNKIQLSTHNENNKMVQTQTRFSPIKTTYSRQHSQPMLKTFHINRTQNNNNNNNNNNLIMKQFQLIVAKLKNKTLFRNELNRGSQTHRHLVKSTKEVVPQQQITIRGGKMYRSKSLASNYWLSDLLNDNKKQNKRYFYDQIEGRFIANQIAIPNFKPYLN